jgi:cephalosporin hydroxylase
VNGRKVLVTLDSEHTKEHVLKELQLYSTLVSLDSYIVVQDTHLNGHPVPWPRLEKTGGPWEAVEEFLKTNKNFEVDRTREKHLATQNPGGFLKRVK